jgi:hypothetical protein
MPSAKKVGIYFGLGNAKFQAGGTYEVSDGSRSVTLLDANGDQNLDVLITGGEPTVLMGDGRGKWSP